MKRSSFFYWFGFAWCFFGGIFAWLGTFMVQQDAKFKNEGTQVAATVKSKRIEERWDSKEKRNDTYYYLTYEFSLPDGTKRTKEESTGRTEYNKYEAEQPLPIAYLPSDPEQSRMIENDDATAGYIFCGIGGFLILLGAAFLVYESKVRRKIRRLMQNGVVGTATVSSVAPGSLTINDIPQWKIYFSFKDMMGRPFEGQSEHMPPHLAEEWQQGDTAQIRYDQNDPSQNLWLGERI